jgi:hypothetical protein
MHGNDGLKHLILWNGGSTCFPVLLIIKNGNAHALNLHQGITYLGAVQQMQQNHYSEQLALPWSTRYHGLPY